MTYPHYLQVMIEKKNTITLILLVSLFLGCSSSSSTLMTFNIRYDNPKDKENRWTKRKQDVIKFIQHHNPDILGIQEGAKKTVDELNQALPKYNYIGVAKDGKTGGEYTAIFYDTSRYKVIDHTTFWLSETPNKPSKGWDAAYIRICTYGTFVRKKKKDTLHVFNTHFDRKGRTSKLEAAKLMVKKISELNLSQSNVVFMGDLNSRINDNVIKTLGSAFDNASEISQTEDIGPKGTFNFFNKDYKPSIQIDYIFTKNLKVLNYKHLNDRRENDLWLSDHLPILIEVEH